MSNIEYRAILPQGWPRPRGYSHAVVAAGRSQVRIAGQIGVGPGQTEVAPGTDFGTQWARAMANLVTVLKTAGGEAQNLVVLRAYITDVDEFNRSGAAIGKSWSELLGKHFPAMTIVQVSRLLDPNAAVEIEGEAVLG